MRSFARLSSWSLLLVALVACGPSERPPDPDEQTPRPDATRSSIALSKTEDVRANGKDAVDITITVVRADGTPMAGRVVTVAASGEGNTLTQSAAPTDAEGVATARLVSTRAGTKTISATVEDPKGAITLEAQPTATFVQLPVSQLVFTASPDAATAGVPFDAEVVLKDADGDVVTGAGNVVSLALGSGPADAQLGGAVEVTAEAGVARFQGLVLKRAGQGYSLVARSPGLPEATSATFDVVPAAPQSFAFTAAASSTTAGLPVGLSLSVLDAFENRVSGYTGTVHFSSDDAGAALPSDYTFTAEDAGFHVFNGGLTLKTAGMRRVTVTDRANTSLVAVVEIAVQPAAADHLAFVSQPSNRSVRAPFGVQVALLDPFGNRALVNAPAVTLSLDKGGVLSGLTTQTPQAGVASFDGLSIAREETYRLTASAAALLPATSNPFVVTDDVAPARPELSLVASTATSVTIGWSAVGDDAFEGMVTSHELRYSAAEIVTDADFANATPVALGAPKAGRQAESAQITGLAYGATYYVALRVTDDAGHSVRSASLPVSTTHARLVFRTQPANGTAGNALAPVQVAVEEAEGLGLTQVTIAVEGVSGVAPLTAPLVQGVATFNGIRIDTAGTGYVLKASAPPLVQVTSAPFAIAPASASRLELAGLAATMSATRTGSVQVTVLDPFDNVVEGYTGSVSLLSSDPAARLPAAHTFVASDKGRFTFTPVIFGTPGEQTISALANGLSSRVLRVTVLAPPPSKFVVTGVPSTTTAGDTVLVTVERLNGFDERETDFRGAVHFSSSDAKAVLPGDYSFTASDAGIKTFAVQWRTAGAQTLKVEDKAAPSIATTKTTQVGWAAPVRLSVSAPSSIQAGHSLSVTVSALDQFDNVVKDYVRKVHFAANPSVPLPADYTFTAQDEGRHQFGFIVQKAAAITFTVSDAAGLSAPFDVRVTNGPVAEIVLARPNGDPVAGVEFPLVAELRDEFGNAAVDFRGTVNVTSGDPKAVLPAPHTFVASDAGRYQFKVTMKTAGSGWLHAEVANVIMRAADDSFTVSPGPASRIAFRNQPSTTGLRGSLGTVSVAVLDAFDNVVTSSRQTITLTLTGGDALAILGGSTSVAASSGVSTFTTLVVDRQGAGYRLQAETSGLPRVLSASFDVTDDIAPATTTLQVSQKTSRQLLLSWTAVGDDGQEGQASAQALRFKAGALDAGSFSTGTAVTVGAPRPQGTSESVLVTGLQPSTAYTFVLRITDDAGNSSYSSVSATTNVDPCLGVTCQPAAPACASDGVSRTTYAAACADVNNAPSCQQTATTTLCPGTGGVCFNNACDRAVKAAPGLVGISEVMHSPSPGVTEYVELTNNTDELLDLNGVVLTVVGSSGASSSFTIGGGGSAPVIVRRSDQFVLAQFANPQTNGGVYPDAVYPSSIRMDSEGSLVLSTAQGELDRLDYTSAFPHTPGKAMSLSWWVQGTAASRYPWYWCDATYQLAGGDYGTPGSENGSCGMQVSPPVEVCRLESPRGLDALTAGSAAEVRGQFSLPSVTDRNLAGNDFYPHLLAELGYGPTSGSAATWTWTPIDFSPAFVTNGASDEVAGALRIGTPGTYRYGIRYSFVYPGTGERSAYSYCGLDGRVDPTAGPFATVNVVAPASGADHVVISEVCGGNGTGTAATDEFIELYNPTNAPVDLSGWTVQYKSATGTSYSSSVTISPASAQRGTIIQPHGYFLLVGANYSGGSYDVRYTFDASASTTAGGHVRIGPGLVSTDVNDPRTVDKLGWGTANMPEGSAAPSHPAVGGSLERKAQSSSTSSTMGTGGRDAAKGNGLDTDDNANDFVTRSVREPQSTLSPTEQL